MPCDFVISCIVFEICSADPMMTLNILFFSGNAKPSKSWYLTTTSIHLLYIGWKWKLVNITTLLLININTIKNLWHIFISSVYSPNSMKFGMFESLLLLSPVTVILLHWLEPLERGKALVLKYFAFRFASSLGVKKSWEEDGMNMFNIYQLRWKG